MKESRERESLPLLFAKAPLQPTPLLRPASWSPAPQLPRPLSMRKHTLSPNVYFPLRPPPHPTIAPLSLLPHHSPRLHPHRQLDLHPHPNRHPHIHPHPCPQLHQTLLTPTSTQPSLSPMPPPICPILPLWPPAPPVASSSPKVPQVTPGSIGRLWINGRRPEETSKAEAFVVVARVVLVSGSRATMVTGLGIGGAFSGVDVLRPSLIDVVLALLGSGTEAKA